MSPFGLPESCAPDTCPITLALSVSFMLNILSRNIKNTLSISDKRGHFNFGEKGTF